MRVQIGTAMWLLSAAALAQSGPSSPAPLAPASTAKPASASPMQAYQRALAKRRLGDGQNLDRKTFQVRLAQAEELSHDGRRDEQIALLLSLVEHPRFDDFEGSEEAAASLYGLGDAFAAAGAFLPARSYLQRLLPLPPSQPYSARAVRRLVEIALTSSQYDDVLTDLQKVPEASMSESTRGEIAYLRGRAAQRAGNGAQALAAYQRVPQSSRFWAQSLYLSGLLEVERGNLKKSEELFCKLADPARTNKNTPLFADEHFFELRDMARLALGRVAHEQYRFDDSRYYYYLVPTDSDKLAEALYESATSRYEKKDFEGARALLDELDKLGSRHRYEDEAWVLRAYLELSRCRFDEADRTLRTFLAKYEPIVRRASQLLTDERALHALVEASASGSRAAADDDAASSIVALLRVDVGYGEMSRRLSQLDLQISGLRGSLAQLDGLSRVLATTGGVKPEAEAARLDLEEGGAEKVAAELSGIRTQLAELEAAHAPESKLASLRGELKTLETSASVPQASTPSAPSSTPNGEDLPDLLRLDRQRGTELYVAARTARGELVAARNALARDAVSRLKLRLSRLLRRARLGRIESVLGRKRGLEVEVEALAGGVLPAAALDSLQVPRYLRDNEEYWPFEGDDWPDEYVGSEGVR